MVKEQGARERGEANQCKGTTKAGIRCRFPALLEGDGYCYTHSPATAKQRAATSRKGGLRTAQKRSALVGAIDFETPAGVRSFLEGLTVAAITGALASGTARDVAGIAESALRVRAGAEVQVTLDLLAARLDALEAKEDGDLL